MSKNLDAAVDTIDAGLRAAAHDRLSIALTNVRHIAEDMPPHKVVDLLAELEVARCAADAIRQADA